MAPQTKIDISENTLRNRGRVLDILLIDRTRHKPSRPFNIIWATDSYQKIDQKAFAPAKQIRREQVTGIYGKLIQPRAAKSKEEQKYRTKDKAEVFTPLHVVEEMNLAIDRSSNNYPVNKKNWINYIEELKLEITCGEAPFITGRYNPTAHTGIVITPKNRVGFFDRKLQQVYKYVTSKKEWLEYAEIALKATYGYEWQGDNLLIARENVLLTLDDFYKDFCKRKLKLKSKQNLTDKQLERFAEIISWNIFQMDGLKMMVPYTGHNKKDIEENLVGGNTLFDVNTVDLLMVKNIACPECKIYGKRSHSPIFVKIKDWQKNRTLKFVDILDG